MRQKKEVCLLVDWGFNNTGNKLDKIKATFLFDTKSLGRTMWETKRKDWRRKLNQEIRISGGHGQRQWQLQKTKQKTTVNSSDILLWGYKDLIVDLFCWVIIVKRKNIYRNWPIQNTNSVTTTCLVGTKLMVTKESRSNRWRWGRKQFTFKSWIPKIKM